MYTRGYVIAFCRGDDSSRSLMLGGHSAELAEHGANFFTVQNLALTWVVFIFVKTIHEFGHGLTCKHFGGEVHEMGAMFIMFTPYLYCNVSDSWLLPDKQKRILVTAAGIFVEMTLAIVPPRGCGCHHRARFAAPDLFQHHFHVQRFDAPLQRESALMKFDGYYMMADALEVPNLKQKEQRCRLRLGAAVSARACTAADPPSSSRTNSGPLFGLYAVASYFYGWLVLYRISTRMFDMLAPYGLDFLSHSYVWLYLFTASGPPLLPADEIYLPEPRHPRCRQPPFHADRHRRWRCSCSSVGSYHGRIP